MTMRAVVWEGKNNVQVNQVPDPEILNPRDAIVKVTLTAICGSDLHLYNRFIPTMKSGDVLGQSGRRSARLSHVPRERRRVHEGSHEAVNGPYADRSK